MEWISVQDEMPPECETDDVMKKIGIQTMSRKVLVTLNATGQRMTKTAYTRNGEWVCEAMRVFPDAVITHWKPYPEPCNN